MTGKNNGLPLLGFSCAILYTIFSLSVGSVTSIALSLCSSVAPFLILLSVFKGNRKLGFLAIFIEMGIFFYGLVRMVASQWGNLGGGGTMSIIVGYLAPQIIFLIYWLYWLIVLSDKLNPKGILIVTLILCTISALGLIAEITTGSGLSALTSYNGVFVYAVYAIAAYELMKKDIIHNKKTPKNNIEAYKMSRQKSGGNQNV